MFPRLSYLRLNENLIMCHLEIFNQLRNLFTLFLEARDGITS